MNNWIRQIKTKRILFCFFSFCGANQTLAVNLHHFKGMLILWTLSTSSGFYNKYFNTDFFVRWDLVNKLTVGHHWIPFSGILRCLHSAQWTWIKSMVWGCDSFPYRLIKSTVIAVQSNLQYGHERKRKNVDFMQLWMKGGDCQQNILLHTVQCEATTSGEDQMRLRAAFHLLLTVFYFWNQTEECENSFW